ncbi:hypothetical protein KCP70_15820 [Salmonella enterica subsp. enterica]|nr:hypothetical protein KCP70_15820 [Salmonella enterica subsp. enterica]
MRHRAIKADNRNHRSTLRRFLLKSQKIPTETGYADSDFTCKSSDYQSPLAATAIPSRSCWITASSLFNRPASFPAPQISRLMGNWRQTGGSPAPRVFMTGGLILRRIMHAGRFWRSKAMFIYWPTGGNVQRRLVVCSTTSAYAL